MTQYEDEAVAESEYWVPSDSAYWPRPRALPSDSVYLVLGHCPRTQYTCIYDPGLGLRPAGLIHASSITNLIESEAEGRRRGQVNPTTRRGEAEEGSRGVPYPGTLPGTHPGYTTLVHRPARQRTQRTVRQCRGGPPAMGGPALPALPQTTSSVSRSVYGLVSDSSSTRPLLSSRHPTN